MKLKYLEEKVKYLELKNLKMLGGSQSSEKEEIYKRLMEKIGASEDEFRRPMERQDAELRRTMAESAAMERQEALSRRIMAERQDAELRRTMAESAAMKRRDAELRRTMAESAAMERQEALSRRLMADRQDAELRRTMAESRAMKRREAESRKVMAKSQEEDLRRAISESLVTSREDEHFRRAIENSKLHESPGTIKVRRDFNPRVNKLFTLGQDIVGLQVDDIKDLLSDRVEPVVERGGPAYSGKGGYFDF